MQTNNTVTGRMQIYSFDELFADAARLVVMIQEASRTLLMKKFGIGAAKADRLLAQLEASGIVTNFYEIDFERAHFFDITKNF